MTASAIDRIEVTAEDLRISGLSALACNVHMLEASLPSPIPGVKPGLANVVTLVLLRHSNWRTAAWATILRLFGGHLALGTLLSPTFIIALAGSISSLACLKILHTPKRIFSAIGLSSMAAAAHICAQFVMVWLFFLPWQALLQLLPFALTFAMVFGIANGFLAEKLAT